MSRNRWLVVLVGFLAVPATALADGIDLPILIGGGIAIFLPLLLFNATVEAPILARLSGIRWAWAVQP